MAKRESKKVIAGVTAEQYQEAMSEYALSDSLADKLIAKMNSEITRVREKYDGDLTECMNTKERTIAIIQAYCTENKEVLFSKARHIENAHGKCGFRMGTPKLKTLPKWTWERVLEKVELLLPEYVRVKKEVNKDMLLDQRAAEGVAPLLNEVGVYVDQDEAFYVELKKEEVAEA